MVRYVAMAQLTVADVDASLAFYSERLGFKPDLRLQDQFGHRVPSRSQSALEKPHMSPANDLPLSLGPRGIGPSIWLSSERGSTAAPGQAAWLGHPKSRAR